MAEYIYVLGFLIAGSVAAVALSNLISIISQGPSSIKRLEKAGYGFDAMMGASLEKEQGGSTIDIIEGLEFVSTDGKLSKVRQTRTVSDEVI